MIENRTAVAFVLDMGPTGLGVARSLGREGIPVVGVDFNSKAPGLRSKYCRPLITTHPLEQPVDTLNILLQEGRKLSRKGILYPATDEYTLFASRFRKELSEHFLFALPPQETIESTINKRKLYELAERVEILCPKTYFPENMHDVEQVKDQIRYPVLIKAYYSHVWRTIFKNKGFKVQEPMELIRRYKQIFEAKLEAMIQSIIVGPASNLVEVHAYLSQKNEPLITFLGRKVRQYPTEIGTGTCMESIHDEELLETALKFFRGIGYRGPGFIEFKKDSEDGGEVMIELNARFSIQSILPTCAGANFPLVQYMELNNQQTESGIDYRDGVRWLDAVQDFQAFCELKPDGKLSVSNWLRSLAEVDCHAYFARDDPEPFARQYAYTLAKLARHIVREHRLHLY